jgi:hypothetical protein
MRTVSFSDRNVQDLLNRNFLCTYTSTEGDPTAGGSIKHRPSDPPGPCIRGNGKQNVQTLFLSPNLEIFHVVTGYIAPDELIDEIQFAIQLNKQLSEGSGERAEGVRQMHRKRLQNMGFSDREIESQTWIERLVSGAQLMPDNRMSDMRRRPGSELLTGQRVAQGDSTGIGLQPNGSEAMINNNIGTDMFALMISQQVLDDHRFSMHYPLISASELERDPTRLVGNGSSFFASSSSR